MLTGNSLNGTVQPQRDGSETGHGQHAHRRNALATPSPQTRHWHSEIDRSQLWRARSERECQSVVKPAECRWQHVQAELANLNICAGQADNIAMWMMRAKVVEFASLGFERRAGPLDDNANNAAPCQKATSALANSGDWEP